MAETNRTGHAPRTDTVAARANKPQYQPGCVPGFELPAGIKSRAGSGGGPDGA
jgi:hypothetical protein